jgi:hypothetical protein
MEEQTQNIEHSPEMQNNYLDAVFDPAQFKIWYPSSGEEEDRLNEQKILEEQNTYNEIVNGLELDMKNLGMELTCSAKIIIRDIALNMMFIQRIKVQMICKNPIRDKEMIKPSETISNQEYSESKKKKTYILYEQQYIREGEIHPAVGKLLPQLEKQIHKGLKELALLPCQQIERQRLTIVKKLRERYTSLNGSEIIVEAKTETTKMPK